MNKSDLELIDRMIRERFEMTLELVNAKFTSMQETIKAAVQENLELRLESYAKDLQIEHLKTLNEQSAQLTEALHTGRTVAEQLGRYPAPEKLESALVRGDFGGPNPHPEGVITAKGDLSPAVKALLKSYWEDFVPDLAKLTAELVPAGKDADMATVLEHVSEQVQNLLPGLIPDPVKGDPGKDAEVDPKMILEIVKDVVVSEAKLLQGPKGEDAPAPTAEQVKSAVVEIWNAEREEIVERLLPKIEHKGVYDPDKVYEPGDEVIKGDSTFRAKQRTASAPPGDHWQCIAKSKVGRRGDPGEPGKKGDPGDPGTPAPKIVGGAMTKDLLVLTFDDGSVLDIQLEQAEEDQED